MRKKLLGQINLIRYYVLSKGVIIMTCRRCGIETGTHYDMCKLCQAGAPISVSRAATPPPTPPAASPPPPPPPQPAPPPPSSSVSSFSTSSYTAPSAQDAADEKLAKAYEKPQKVKEPKAPKEPRASSGNENIFAVLGLIFAFFYPLCGVILSFVGLKKSNELGGRLSSIIGIFVGLVLTVVVVLIILLFTGNLGITIS